MLDPAADKRQPDQAFFYRIQTGTPGYNPFRRILSCCSVMNTIKNTGFRTIGGYQLSPLSRNDLKHLSEAADACKIERLRFTPSSQIAVSCASEEQFSQFSQRIKPILKPLPTNGISTIFCCGGCNDCDHGLADTDHLASLMQTMDLPVPMPAKLKVAIAGCPRCCTMPRLRDIGLSPYSGKSRKWNLSFGGNGGIKPRIGDVLGTGLGLDEVFALIHKAVTLYQKEAKSGMRTAAYVEHVSKEVFLEKLHQ